MAAGTRADALASSGEKRGTGGQRIPAPGRERNCAHLDPSSFTPLAFSVDLFVFDFVSPRY
jgi:hypothetical protein